MEEVKPVTGRRDPGYNPEREIPRLERYRAARRDPGLVVIEGLHALRHALRFGAEPFEVLAEDPDELLRLAEELAPDVASRIAELVEPIDPQELARLTPAPIHTAVIALAPRPDQNLEAALASPRRAPVVFLEEPADTYNIGAVVRVAAAADAAALLVSGKHDPWNPGSVRTGAGLQFAIPCARIDVEELPNRVSSGPTVAGPEPSWPGTTGTNGARANGPSLGEGGLSGRPLVALDTGGEEISPGRIPPRAIFAFGSERYGLSDELIARADLCVRLPMKPGVSSLNLATAVAAVLYSVPRD